MSKNISGTERTKQKLIQAAGILAARQGLSNVSTRAVSRESGENIGSIHYHFGGKEGLFKAMIHEAMQSSVRLYDPELLEKLENPGEASPLELSNIIRAVIAENIRSLFRSGQPDWHVHVIYQLIQQEDELFEQFSAEYLDPEMAKMKKLIRAIKPELSDEEIFLHACLIKLPIYAHATFMKALLLQLNAKAYSDEYLQNLEDLLVRQTQLLLELPLDKA
jgi:AcrR family transcriptional regulator